MAEGDVATFARRYERRVLQRASWEAFGGNGFYDVGWWGDGVTDQRSACEALVDRLLDRVPLGPARVLDLGCGAGATTDRARETLGAASALGVDVAGGLVQVAARLHPRCGFLVADATALPLRDGCVDVVTCVEAALHVRSRTALLAEAHRVLAPGGRVALADLLVGDRALLGPWLVPDADGPLPADYASTVVAAGFEDVVVEDVTDRAWRAWCARAERAAAPQEREYFRALADRGALAYLLVTARRATPRAAPRPSAGPRAGG